MVPGLAEETDKTHSDALIMQVCIQTWDHSMRGKQVAEPHGAQVLFGNA